MSFQHPRRSLRVHELSDIDAGEAQGDVRVVSGAKRHKFRGGESRVLHGGQTAMRGGYHGLRSVCRQPWRILRAIRMRGGGGKEEKSSSATARIKKHRQIHSNRYRSFAPASVRFQPIGGCGSSSQHSSFLFFHFSSTLLILNL